MNTMLNPATFAALLPLPAEGAAASWAPSTLFSGWSEDGTDISVPIASFTGLTEAFADATTGDARQVILSFCKSTFEWYNDLSTQPEAVVIAWTPGRMQPSSSRDFSGKQKTEYKFTFYADFPEGTVTAEPE